MKVNHNMSAMVSNNQLLRTENSLTNSLERLSSGLRINHAADDAAGMAIATKMKAQIQGLGQASRNASDGVSVLDTTDGALTEVTNMLQRMRELSVNAASDTNTPEDKRAVQAEIASLREEIDRVAKDTEFNTKPLLNGTLDKRVYADDRGITRINISDSVASGKYDIDVTANATHAVSEGVAAIAGNSAVPAGASGKVVINGVAIEISAGDTFETVYEKMRAGAEIGNVNLLVVDDLTDTTGTPEDAGYVPTPVSGGGNLVYVSNGYGSNKEVNITCDNPALATYLGIPAAGVQETGTNATVAFGTAPNGFSPQATILTDGTHVTITDKSGFKIEFEAEAGATGDIQLDVTNLGTMMLQIGANEGQTMEVRIPEISSKSLYIDDVNVCNVNGAGDAISSFDKALSKVSESRSRIGAYQNRLDSAVASLDGTEENMTAALSRIEDIDMAKEMSEYTKYNVLSQAATSVLAQANDLPQQVLQLLQ